MSIYRLRDCAHRITVPLMATSQNLNSTWAICTLCFGTPIPSQFWSPQPIQHS
ncbi:hypothetical protein BKA67DRAFT_576963 [Truncatella angustata]|uniref:Uncharacterized protein n=1 Tax=Truncatella angustata TaxID=152316 RepID=A0A9P8UFS1_9PEZI|nr:uncharacterized protein BKA67DRAFT_576963 [Truncatella angustata]KAH6649170.1 hypothetical protein BKA67DRAFT_576963 [Truncatella angustata]